jgi:hypothetical protein
VLHGRALGDLGRGLRSVAWERASGQVIQALAVGGGVGGSGVPPLVLDAEA